MKVLSVFVNRRIKRFIEGLRNVLIYSLGSSVKLHKAFA
jgi:hypothetical protein